MSTLFLDKPTLSVNTMPPRQYQMDAINAVREQFRIGKRKTMLILPTGTGKTAVFGNLARLAIEKGGKVLILAHRGELIDQAASTLDKIGVECGIEKAGSFARSMYDPSCVIATVQTMQGDRLKSWPQDHFNVMVLDECHHACSPTYTKIIKYFSRHAYILGVTATADRSDGSQMSEVFESIAYEMSLWQAMTAEPPGPYLCRLKVVQCDVDIDLRELRTVGGDFNQADLEAAIRPKIETLANAIRQEVGERQTLVFTPDVGSAQAMATALQSIGLRADWISGDSADRKEKLHKYATGQTQVLANCALLTEGYDAPKTSAIVLCRPTKSRSLYSQMIGRGTRLSPGKADCLVIDFNYITSKLDLVKPIELFDTTHTDDEVNAIAAEIVKKEKGKDLLMAIEEAEIEHRKRQVIRITAREKKVSYRKISFDPMAVGEVLGIPSRGAYNSSIYTASPRQIELLKRFKVENPEGMSATRARTMLDVLFSRAKSNLATVKQTSWMIKMGIDPLVARQKTFQEASAILDGFFNKKKSAAS